MSLRCVCAVGLAFFISTQSFAQLPELSNRTLTDTGTANPSPMSVSTLNVSEDTPWLSNTEPKEPLTSPTTVGTTTASSLVKPSTPPAPPLRNEVIVPAASAGVLTSGGDQAVTVVAPGVLATTSSTSLGGAVRVTRIGATTLQVNATIIAQGEIVNVDRDGGRISLRDSKGDVTFFPVTDESLLRDLNNGDQIQIYR